MKVISFVNEYAAEGKETLTAQKSLTGAELRAEQFSFSAAADSGNPAEGIDETNFIKDATNDAAGTVDFGSLKFTKAGTWKYTVTETSEAGSGVTVDRSEYEVTFAVTDPGTGTLSVAKSIKKVKDAAGEPVEEASQAVEVISFVNVYSASGEGEVKVQKILNGREWKDGDAFTFTISAAEGVPMPAETEITITKDDADQPKSFGTITFTEAGTYTYTVKETKGDIAGITYDEIEHQVVIEVVDNGDGTLIAKPGTELIRTVTSTNEYGVSGKGEIKVQKILEGRAWTDNDEFTFTIEAVQDETARVVPMPSETEITITKMDVDQVKSFGTITFTQEGEYTYTIKETRGSIGGIAYDETDHTVTIKVVDDGEGNLIADKDSSLITTKQIMNTYSASGEGEVKVQKILEGRDWTDDDKFTFTISAAEGVPMPDETEISITKEDADQTKSFGKITFTKAGEYTYTVKETRGDLSGVTYDEREHLVTIKVIDDGKGNLVAEEGDTLIKTEKIINTYSPENVTISGEKTWDLQGYDESLMPESITAYIKDGETTVDTLTVKAGEDGKWIYTSKELPRYRADGKTEIIYTVDEEVPKGFAKVVTGNNIKNTYQPEFTKIMV